jgi:hypothetical protein
MTEIYTKSKTALIKPNLRGKVKELKRRVIVRPSLKYVSRREKEKPGINTHCANWGSCWYAAAGAGCTRLGISSCSSNHSVLYALIGRPETYLFEVLQVQTAGATRLRGKAPRLSFELFSRRCCWYKMSNMRSHGVSIGDLHLGAIIRYWILPPTFSSSSLDMPSAPRSSSIRRCDSSCGYTNVMSRRRWNSYSS